MKINELKQKLQARNVPAGYYSLNGYADDALCIEQVGSEWIVYDGERGKKHRVRTFQNEEDACAEFWSQIVRLLAYEEKKRQTAQARKKSQ